ncbi:MAG: SpoIIE family protein phosphatase [Candidatus Cyclobacteriaceae bacterium M3_2C_046]
MKSKLYYLLTILLIFLAIMASGQENTISTSGDAHLEQLMEQGNLNEACRILNEKANDHWDQKQFKKAIELFKRSLQLYQQIGNDNAMASLNTNLGLLQAELNEFALALDGFDKAFVIRQKMADKSGMAGALINKAIVFNQLDHTEKAIKQLENALSLAKELNNVKLLRNCYSMLAENHERLGNNQKSMEYFEYYASLEKLIQKEKFKKIEETNQHQIVALEQKTKQAQDKVEQREALLKSTAKELYQIESQNKASELQIELLNKEKQLKEIKLEEQKARIRNESQLKNSFFMGFLFVGLFAFAALRGLIINKRMNAKLTTRNKEIEQQNREIEEQKGVLLRQRDEIQLQTKEIEDALGKLRLKDNNITSSINYAKRIQEAFLPNLDLIQTHLPESFVYFNPRDLVSGDFYWFKYVAPVDDDFFSIKEKIIISAVDCTGHGVPGAFMSLIGMELLNQIVNLKGITSAERILNELHRQIRHSLDQESSQNRDGMDMSLCVIHKEERALEFAGAKNPLIYIQNGELFHLKGDKMPIGGQQNEDKREFTPHRISLKVPTTVYLLSDGIQDQFGGPENRKFMIKKLKALLLEIHQRPMEEQYAIIEDTVEQWKGQNKQVDDMLIIGFKI